MAKQIVNEMATNLTLDSNSASQALKELTREVKNSSAEAKILENQYKASGDVVSSSKAKYEGLQSTLEAQKTKIEALKSGLDNVNTSTKKGQDLQQYLNGELAKAERQYTSYQGQLEKATQSYKYQESGLASLNDELKHSNSLTDARVQKLEAEGRTEEAQKVKLEGLKNTQENYTKQLEIQKKELQELASQGDKSSDSYKRQELRVEQMGAKLANTTGDIKHFNDVKIKPEVVGEATVKGKLESIDDKLDKTRGNFGKFLGANLIASGITNALQSVQSHISGIFQAGVDYNKQLQNINVGLDNFTNGNSKLSGQLKDIIQQTHEASGYALDTTTLLTKKSFGFMGKNVDKAKELSDAWINVGRSTGMSDEKLQASIGTFGKIAASGDITSSSLTKVNKSLPGFSSAMAQHMGITEDKLRDLAKNGKLSMEDLGNGIEEMSKMKGGTKGLENYQKTFDGFTQHFEERYKSLSGKITESFFSQSNNMLSGLSKSLDGKEVDKSFNRIGDSANKAVNTVVKAFSSSFKGSKTNPVADMANFTADSIEKIGNWVAKHADDIKDFFKMVKELGATGFSTMGTTLKIALPLLEDLGKFASKHPTTFKVLAGSILGLNLALKATLSTIAVFGKTKAVFGALSGLIIKPKVDGSGAKRELGIIGKIGKGIGKSVVWTGKLAVKSVLKSLELIGDATIKTGKALWWTAKLATKVFLKSLELLGGAVIKSGKLIGKGLVFTAKIATKGASLALAGLVKTAKVTGTGIKLAFNFLKANPLILLVTAITAVVIAFAELYKHNKKFRNFVNDLVKSAQQFFKGIGKWFMKAYKTIMNFFKDILNFVKKDWKEILLFIVNPFAGAFALVYKHNAKFRKAVNNLVKDVVNFFKNMGKSIGDIFNSIFKNVSKIYNGIKDFIGDTTHNIYKGWVNSWKSIFNFFGDTWNNIKKFGSNSINSLKGTFDDVLGKIGKSFSNTWNGIKDGFKAMWDGMKQLAGDGINAVIKIPNAGIDGINGLIHDFGGSKHAIGKIPRVKFANGTGAIQELTHAVLNDGNDSPETGNKETLIHPNGKMEIVQGQNIERLLLPGTEVLNARETAMFMGLQGVKHFAGGTGFWSKLLSGAGNAVSNIAGSAWSGLKNGVDKFTKMFSYITGAVADPSGTLGKVLNLKSGGVSSVMDGVAGGAYKKVTSTAKDWWSTLWSMASESSSSGTGSKGDDYAFKNKSKDSGVDPWGYFYRECVSFIASRLKNLGVSASLFSHLGNGADWVNAKVPHSKTPKVGDVAVYAAGSEFGNHASIVTGVQGDKISGEEYNWSGDGQYHTYNGRRASGATTFLDFGRSAGAKAKEVATNNPLSKLIKKQTGGMMEWIQKFIAPINDSSTGADNDVQSWSGDVKKALSKLGLSTSGSMVSKVLKQIQTESGGNAKAVQHGYRDVNTGGNEARGLMQVTPATFRAYAMGGHKNIMNGYDNILAGLNYAKHRYGDSLSFLGQGHGYANGGLITKHQIAEISEGNQPEMIIPLSGMKSSRGFELLGKTAVAMAQRDGATGTSTNSDSDVINYLVQAVELLTQLVKVQGSPVPVNAVLDKNDLYKKQASDVNLRDYQSLI
ncbi:tape measure domain-containing protein [Leuconostoc mesenteroides]|uniref:tape measure protein n=1 Tax=Leuconostoc mesenteroides TaxID=1245 RepID=UPI0010647A5A|nr:tape measure protein [Leuconostoc mesenteroides]TDV88516.1 tape measure domain-containing protein [Leuconostoc mesenteroides]